MSLTTATKNKLLDYLATDEILYAAGLTSEALEDEITTGRQVVVFTAAADAVITGSTPTPIDVLAGTTITHLALYNALTDGENIGIFAITSPETFANDGELSVIGLSITLS